MDPKSFTRWTDRFISHLAAKQHGVVARWQLLAAGVTAEQIKVGLRSGRLHKMHAGAYLVGHTDPAAARPRAGGVARLRRAGSVKPQKRGESLEPAPLPSLGSRLGHGAAGAERRTAPDQGRSALA